MFPKNKTIVNIIININIYNPIFQNLTYEHKQPYQKSIAMLYNPACFRTICLSPPSMFLDNLIWSVLNIPSQYTLLPYPIYPPHVFQHIPNDVLHVSCAISVLSYSHGTITYEMASAYRGTDI